MNQHFTETKKLEWSVNTAAFLSEIGNHNNQMAIMARPLEIFSAILYEVGERASELNDPILNGLMCRLSIYAVADQYSPDFNPEIVEKVIDAYHEAKKSL